MEWFLVVSSVAAFSAVPGRHIGPLTEESCSMAQHALHDSPSAIDARCLRAIGYIACKPPSYPTSRYACPIFEGEKIISLWSRRYYP
jgi:hypothetical protein